MNSDNREVFLGSVLDSLPEQIAVIDASGVIIWVNKPWNTFAEENGAIIGQDWRKVSYLDVCLSAFTSGDPEAGEAYKGLLQILSGDTDYFYYEYSCHSPWEKRWFIMRVRKLDWAGPKHFLITHQDITARKLAEVQIESLAMLDGLTGIGNRRAFDTFLTAEWQRARRNQVPVALLMLDIDFFKAYNDTYGHLMGDECLKKVSGTLKSFMNRPADLVARYGGEEFAFVFGDMKGDAALDYAEEIRKKIQALGIPHENGGSEGCITISIGVASRVPEKLSPDALPELIDAADTALYAAKENGRNRVVLGH